MTADKPEGARLKPCPFCGGKVEILTGEDYTTFRHSGTDNCFLEDSEDTYRADAAEILISQWNTRTEPPILRWAEQNPEAVKALLEGEAMVIDAEEGCDMPYVRTDKFGNVELDGSFSRLDIPYKPIEESK